MPKPPSSINACIRQPLYRHLATASLTVSIITLAGCNLTATQPQAPQVITKTETVEVVPKHLKPLENKVVLGEVEHVTVAGWSMKARIDSGATTTSIDARNIKSFERDGKDWVRFDLINRDTKASQTLEEPVSRTVKIKRHGSESQHRYVVKMQLELGPINEKVEVSLNDRSEFTYPVLIGRNFLLDRAIVDVSQEHATQ